MKRFILALALVAGVSVFSSALEPVTATIDTVSSTMTTAGIDISSHTPTSVIVSTRPLYRQVCVQNISTSVWLSCGENVAVSTFTTSDLIGTIIPAATSVSAPDMPVCFAVPAGNHFYCIHDGALRGPSRAVVTRGR
jgi:hypothetical protein